MPPACSTTKGIMVWMRTLPYLRCFSAAAAIAAARGMWEVAGAAVCVTTEGHVTLPIMWLPSRAACRKVRSGRQLGEYAAEAARGRRAECDTCMLACRHSGTSNQLMTTLSGLRIVLQRGWWWHTMSRFWVEKGARKRRENVSFCLAQSTF